MKQSKNEIIKKFLLMTNYDSKKTLTENDEFLKSRFNNLLDEQTSDAIIANNTTQSTSDQPIPNIEYKKDSVRNTPFKANANGEDDNNGPYAVKIVKDMNGNDMALIFDQSNTPRGYYRGKKLTPDYFKNVKQNAKIQNTINYLYGWFGKCKPAKDFSQSWSNKIQATLQNLSIELTEILETGPESGTYDADRLKQFFTYFDSFDNLCLFNHYYGVSQDGSSKLLSQLSYFFNQIPQDTTNLTEIFKKITELASSESTPTPGGTTPGGTTPGGGTGGSGGGWRDCSKETVYTKGCYSEKIKTIQKCLGFSGPDVDGKYGDKTAGAVYSKLNKYDFDINKDFTAIGCNPNPNPNQQDTTVDLSTDFDVFE